MKNKNNTKDNLTSEEFFKKWEKAIEKAHQKAGTDSQYSEECDEFWKLGNKQNIFKRIII